jgi:hypothetical protein
LVAASIGTSFGLGAFGGGLGSYVSQMMDYGASGINWSKVYTNSFAYGVFALTASLIPQGSITSPLGNGWAAAFCVGGEIVIDAANWFYGMVESGKIKLPHPIMV